MCLILKSCYYYVLAFFDLASDITGYCAVTHVRLPDAANHVRLFPRSSALCTKQRGSYWLELRDTGSSSSSTIRQASPGRTSAAQPDALSAGRPTRKDDDSNQGPSSSIGSSTTRSERSGRSSQSHGSCYAVLPVRLLTRPAMLVADLSVLAGRRANRHDDAACSGFRSTWRHSQELQSLMLVASTSR